MSAGCGMMDTLYIESPKNILDMNLEDFNTRLYLMIAFRLIDEG
jgi:hypothetical protein